MIRVNPRPFRTMLFRMAIGYAVLFVVSVTALFGFLYWNTAIFVDEQTEETIQAEITGLAEHYRQAGLLGLRDVISERSKGQRLSLYLLTDPMRRPIAGNLDQWPVAETLPGGWISFAYERQFSASIKQHQARARHLVLAGGFNLLVGQDVQDQIRFERRLRLSLVWVGAFALLIGLSGGLALSRNWLRHVDAVNRTARDIMAGDLSRRVPVRGADDELDRLAKNLNDMLDRIEALMLSLRQVTDNIAHDLRSPLNRLRGRLEVALMTDDDCDAYRQALSDTVKDADQLLQTFNALLLIGEAEAGLDRHAIGEIDLSARVADLIELFEPAADDAGLALAAEIAPEITLVGNLELLSQAFVNLLDNAIKYTPSGGRIGVKLGRETDGAVFLAVADSGPGIPASDREHVLERFVRLESCRSSPGSGLGLSLVKAVAKMHKAELALGDNLPGLIVTLRFPAQRN
ncbi:MAG: HAMP domain-containing sensor histidine kinase [Proteobacteria bacterium]|nr:HAMP domain-containing sensor histidine kinase [Pseudomonadota bacterium]